MSRQSCDDDEQRQAQRGQQKEELRILKAFAGMSTKSVVGKVLGAGIVSLKDMILWR